MHQALAASRLALPPAAVVSMQRWRSTNVALRVAFGDQRHDRAVASGEGDLQRHQPVLGASSAATSASPGRRGQRRRLRSGRRAPKTGRPGERARRGAVGDREDGVAGVVRQPGLRRGPGVGAERARRPRGCRLRRLLRRWVPAGRSTGPRAGPATPGVPRTDLERAAGRERRPGGEAAGVEAQRRAPTARRAPPARPAPPPGQVGPALQARQVVGPPAFGPVPDRPSPPNGCEPTTAPIWLRLT